MADNDKKDLALKWKKSEEARSASESDSAPNQKENDVADQDFHSYSRFDHTSGNFTDSYGNEDKQIEIGRNLAAIFKQKEIHPVLIFGSKSSGKTMLLASLFKYYHTDDADDADGSIDPCIDAICKSGDDQFDTLEDHLRLANFFLDKIVFRVISGLAAEATLYEIPFFIPVEIKVSKNEPQRYAFLEGKGEWYQPNDNQESESTIKKFKGVICGLLQEYEGPLSVIYVAPCISGGLNSRGDKTSTSEINSHANCDRGLVGAMDEYMRLRGAKCAQDHHLFLISKWDTECGGLSTEEFYSPTNQKINDILENKFNLSWKRFCNNLEPRVESTNYAAYCSGKIVEDKMVRLAKEDAAVVSRYPRRVWHWLHKNKSGKSLYADMIPPTPGIVEKLLAFLRGD